MTYQHFEKFDMISVYIESGKNEEMAQNLYFVRYPERRQPFNYIFRRLEHNLKTYGSFTMPRSKTYIKENKENEEISVLGFVEANNQDGTNHRKKYRNKNNHKSKLRNNHNSSKEQKSLISKEEFSNKSSLHKHDIKSSNKILKTKKDILKKIKKKIVNFHMTVNGEADDKVPLNSYIFDDRKKVEKHKNKKKFKRKRSLSETTDDNDVKPLLKKIKTEKETQNKEPIKLTASYLDSSSAKIKNKKKKNKINKESSNREILGGQSPTIESKHLIKIKKMLKNVEIEQTMHETKKKINKKLNDKKKNKLKKSYDGTAGEVALEENRIDPVQLKKRKKQLEKLQNLILKKQETASSKKEEPVLTLRQKMMQKLKAARFRFLNEQIYTTTSKETEKIFRRDPDAFKAYHEGYRQQVKRWPLNPLDRIIKSVIKMPKSHVIADFGCGEARLASSVEQQVHSFDLVAANDTVIACDMARVPLQDSSIDVAVFCLSLMGTNLKDYLMEANRVLKKGGLLKIAEVESRFEDINTFTKDCEQFGFKKTWMDLSHNLFYFIDFRKESSLKGKKKLPAITLQPCLYKKR